MRKKKSILFDVYMQENWIGGVYYIRSIVYSVTLNKNITDEYNIVVVVNEKTKSLFDSLKEKITLVKVSSNNKWIKMLQLMVIVKKYNVNWYYNIPQGKQGLPFKKIGIYWIPDFQHVRYPQFFEREELEKRKAIFGKISKGKNWLILSSEDCFNDFKMEYPNYSCPVKVVHFVSYIQNEIAQVTPDYEREILKKYTINKKYIFISNLFWQHKNHIVVFEAIKKLALSGKLAEYDFVFTGELKDYRNADYYNQLRVYIEDSVIKEKIKILGFIDRAEQLTIMKNCECIIQPSLFEGWGTVLEDAKVFGKKVVLSNIPVHFEQKDDNCYIFDAHNADDLVDKLEIALGDEKKTKIDDGISETEKKAYEYSKNLEEVFLGVMNE